MPRDRLNEMKSPDDAQPEMAEKKPEKSPKKSKVANDVPAAGPDIMAGFFDEVSGIKDAIQGIKLNVDSIKQLHQKALNVILEEQSAENGREMDKLIAITNKAAGEVRNRIKNMEQQNKKLAKQYEGSSDVSIRVSQHANLTKKFLDIMTDYKNLQKEYQEKYKARLQRQFLIVKPNATTDEVDKMLSGETGPIFAQQILETGQKAQARQALAEIQERHQDIVRIEKSILELQQLFADMAVLVAAQGEQIDQIEIHVSNAVDTTEKGVQALHKAVKDQKKSRRKMCMIMACIIIVVVVVVLGTTLTKH
ncbi:hypothetical protein SmJEL517_g01817 [Synchytrium microbalum]|uniref:t-SNARE coiled-coil homology domain-containing protein n=1 Tax=Synchytrium microbalum TaxID=1806994 RepID=A0A507C8X0_9FUNG|nr:uncharacterized protein SmJEL517_g01817 [Synchytrium microbalum]TPX35971.1 hypothetical protein SmJEL517_g01817 [Synchytrium microbalum]